MKAAAAITAMVLTGAVLLLKSAPAHAEVRLEGWLIATRACPAFQSIRKQTNPGDVRTEADRAYPLFAKNKDAATHYLIEMKDADPSRRWVEVGCGVHAVPAPGQAGGGDKGGDGGQGGDQTGGSTDFVLAASWQPGFCETRPSKPECASQTGERFDATHFALHGLWPQPRSNVYCHVAADVVADDKAGRWEELPAVALEAGTRTALDKIMPGTQSKLERHEWIKHGTCHGGSSEDYFADSIRLMDVLNASAVQDLFEASIGSELSAADIRDAFDEAFGAGAGERVKVSCVNDGNRRLIGEITIGLSGDMSEEASFADLLFASAPTDAGCPSGIVDPAGLQ